MGNHNYALSECTNGWEKPQSPGFAPVSWKDGCPTFALAYSGFPVELSGVGSLHAAFLNESRTRCCWWSRVQEIRIRGTKTMFFECFHLIAHRNPFYGGWASPRLPGDSAVPRQIRGAEQRHLRQPIHGLSGQPVEGLYGQLKVFGTAHSAIGQTSSPPEFPHAQPPRHRAAAPKAACVTFPQSPPPPVRKTRSASH
jgi:hypothetical protein